MAKRSDSRQDDPFAAKSSRKQAKKNFSMFPVMYYDGLHFQFPVLVGGLKGYSTLRESIGALAVKSG
jgi:hypothetical protein